MRRSEASITQKMSIARGTSQTRMLAWAVSPAGLQDRFSIMIGKDFHLDSAF
ncbi:hypothetical protein BAUCODRAFT_37064 [Baudoinia panamericana UAMH 10762]|uniref:Uncharacterized protein n=1 Tax=Baudoinia panamericana (strain UAMH 10762) TaxID=717646 RepID=M2MPH8_BAUPA|nr:uncharacterized protein BAUCODRAFT_37064 [Baudoinia panamericana UAMH 10762]EMC93368.1 hypothetical protein BAUCODRAFT_37064 [Baudoinia panamericana UAMH 10762]